MEYCIINYELSGLYMWFFSLRDNLTFSFNDAQKGGGGYALTVHGRNKTRITVHIENNTYCTFQVENKLY